ncbi:MAG: hypothetical protein AAF456_02480 [Planctomycetota bacterium]
MNSILEEYVDQIETSPACIVDYIENGHGIIPLLGAGISSPAGIPVLPELSRYLHYCIGLSLGLVREFRTWSPRHHRWPELDVSFEYLKRNWQNEIELALDKASTWREKSIYQEALGALAEWRSSLFFLSRISNQPGDLQLRSPSYEIIDTFFNHITLNKRPALSHKLLSLLVGPVNIPLLLTTNFDELIENAFEANGQRLASIDIHRKCMLPSLNIIDHELTLLKMHGGRFGLRADYSLDESVSELERLNFVSYFQGFPIDRDDWTRPQSIEWSPEELEALNGLPVEGEAGVEGRLGQLVDTSLLRSPKVFEARNGLLVAGLSGADGRINQFIETCLLRLNEEFKIFWVCYNTNDLKSVSETYQAWRTKYPWIKPDQLKMFYSQDVGLFFTELLQMRTSNIPRTHSVFPGTSRVSLPPQRWPASPEIVKDNGAEFGAQISSRIDQLVEATRERFVGVTSTEVNEERCHGVTRNMREAFDRQLSRGRYCIWIDLDDVTSTDDFFEQLVDGMCQRIGFHGWPAVVIESDVVSQVQEIDRVASGLGRRWVIFVNGREGAGTNMFNFNNDARTGWLGKEEDDYEIEDLYDSTRNSKSLFALLSLLSSEKSPMTTIVMSYQQDEEIDEALTTTRLKSGEVEPLSESAFDEERLEQLIDEVEELAMSDPAHFEFLAFVLMFRRTRYAVPVLNKARQVYKDSNEFDVSRIRSAEDIPIVKKLLAGLLMRKRPGGYLWFHTPVRDDLRQRLNIAVEQASESTENQLLARLDADIASSYVSVFLSSKDSLSAFESAIHNCFAAIRLSKDIRSAAPGLAIRVASELDNANRILTASKDYLLGSRSSRASCRRLTYIRAELIRPVLDEWRGAQGVEEDKSLVFEAAQELLLTCLSLKRAVAREITEHQTAFWRHRQSMDQFASGLRSDDRWLAKGIERDQYRCGPGQKQQVLNSAGAPFRDSRQNKIPFWDLGGNERKNLLFYIEWTIEVGLLHTSARAYDSSHLAFSNVYNLLAGRTAPKTGRPTRHRGPKSAIEFARSSFEKFEKFVLENKAKIRGDRKFSLAIFKALRRHYYLTLVHTNTIEFLNKLEPEEESGTIPETDQRKCLREKNDALLGLTEALSELTRKWSIEFTSELNWSFEQERQAFLTNRSYRLIKKARRSMKQEPLEEARKWLNFADGLVDLRHGSSPNLSVGVIHLHRALAAIEEGLLTRLSLTNVRSYAEFGFSVRDVFQGYDGGLYQEWCRDQDQMSDQIIQRLGIRESGSEDESVEGERSRSVVASLTRARQLLDRSEHCILSSRKNIWWTTILLQSRLRYAHLGLLSDCAQPSSRFVEGRSFFHTQFARASDVSIVESDVLDLVRIARLDVVRLAKACKYFANCLNAVLVLVLRAGSYYEHEHTINSLYKTAETVLSIARQRFDIRIELSESRNEGKGFSTLDSTARDLCEGVFARFEAVLENVEGFCR